MSKVCAICGKHPLAGRSITRKGQAKKKGGVGKHITGVSKRVFYPNLQRVRAVIAGEVKSVRVCTGCLKAGKIIKP